MCEFITKENLSIIGNIATVILAIMAFAALIATICIYKKQEEKAEERLQREEKRKIDEEKNKEMNALRIIYEDLKLINERNLPLFNLIIESIEHKNKLPSLKRLADLILDINIDSYYSIRQNINIISYKLSEKIMVLYHSINYYKYLANLYINPSTKPIESNLNYQFTQEYQDFIDLFINLDKELIPALEKALSIKDSNLTDKI